MTFNRMPWYPIAAVLSGINLAAGGFALGTAEPAHAAVHAALAVAFGLWARRLGQAPSPGAGQARLEELEAELGDMRGELSEMQERVDFAERLLAQRPDPHRVEAERHGGAGSP